LSRYESKPGRKVTAPAKRLGLSDRRYERGRIQWADPRDGREQLSRCIRTSKVRKLRVEGDDASIEGAPLSSHVLDQNTDPTADRHLPGEKLFQSKFKRAPPLGNYDSPLEQNRPKLVDQSRALANQPIPSPVQALHVELLVALQIDKAHSWAGRGFRYRLGIPIVVLLRLHVRTNIFGRHQPYIVAMLTKLTAKMMGAATGFHRHQTGRHSRRQLQHAVPTHPAPQQHFPCLVQPDDAANVLSKIDTKNLDLIHRLTSVPSSSTTQSCAEGKGRAIP